MAPELPGYHGFGWQHPETGAVQAMLQYAGVVAPHTGQPYSEEMLLGLGGGVGCVYFVFEFSQSTWFTLFTRYAYGTATDFIEKEARRVGATPVFSETGSRRVALANLRAALDRGRPALVWLDQASLPYYYLPGWMRKYLAYTVVVHALDEEAGVAGIADLAATSMPVSTEQLADARAAITSNKNRVMTLEPPDGPVDLAEGVRAGIRDCHTLMLAPRINNLGLPALAKWADLVANTRNLKGWPTVFPSGVKLYQGLCDTYHGIETGGTGGGAFRPMYAAFLDEAATVLALPSLHDVAAMYREAARQWSALAQAALPDSVPLLARARALMDEKRRLLAEEGAPALERVAAVSAELEALKQAATDFPLDARGAQGLLDDLRARLLSLHDTERSAIEALRALVP